MIPSFKLQAPQVLWEKTLAGAGLGRGWGRDAEFEGPAAGVGLCRPGAQEGRLAVVTNLGLFGV